MYPDIRPSIFHLLNHQALQAIILQLFYPVVACSHTNAMMLYMMWKVIFPEFIHRISKPIFRKINGRCQSKYNTAMARRWLHGMFIWMQAKHLDSRIQLKIHSRTENGNYFICPTSRKFWIYWNMERKNSKIINNVLQEISFYKMNKKGTTRTGCCWLIWRLYKHILCDMKYVP